MSEQDTGWADVLVNMADSINRLESGVQTLKTPPEYKSKVAEVTGQLDVLKKSLSEAAKMSLEVAQTQKAINSQVAKFVQEINQASIVRREEVEQQIEREKLSKFGTVWRKLGLFLFLFFVGTVYGHWGVSPAVFRMSIDTEETCKRFGGAWYNNYMGTHACMISLPTAEYVDKSNSDH